MMLRMRFLHGLLLGREGQEHFFEAHAHGAQLEQSEAAADDRARKIPPHVAPALAVDLVRRGVILAVGGLHADDTRDALQAAVTCAGSLSTWTCSAADPLSRAVRLPGVST